MSVFLRVFLSYPYFLVDVQNFIFHINSVACMAPAAVQCVVWRVLARIQCVRVSRRLTQGFRVA